MLMKRLILKNICIYILLGCFIFTLVPQYSAEDISKDEQVNLKDALIFAKNLYESDSQKNQTQLAALISTVQILAGLKTAIQADNHESKRPMGVDTCYIHQVADNILKEDYSSSGVLIVSYSCQSINLGPPKPPPQIRLTA